MRVSLRVQGGATSIVGKGCSTVFFGLFFLVGSAVTLLALRDAVESIGTRKWRPTPCTIEEMRIETVDDGRNPYQIAGRFRYVVEGVEYRAETVGRSTTQSGDYGTLGSMVEAWPVGEEATCFVNPSDSNEAILLHDTWAGALLAIPFTLIFVAVGAGGMFFTWFGSKGGKRVHRTAVRERAVSERKESELFARRRPKGITFVYAFCGLFVVAGVAGCWFTFVGPMLRLADMQRWSEVSCRVVSSRVRSYEVSDDDGSYSVFWPDVLYEYQLGNRTFRDNSVDSSAWTTTNETDAQALISRYAVGSERVGYVNPADPHDAALRRDFSAGMLLGLIPLVFSFFGLLGIVVVRSSGRNSERLRRQRQKRYEPKEEDRDERDDREEGNLASRRKIEKRAAPERDEGEWHELPARSGRLGVFFFMLIFATFWNGIVSVFLWELIDTFRKGDPEWFLFFFLIPFEIVGVVVILIAIYQFLAMWNPRPIVLANRKSIEPGQELQFDWRFRGRTHRIRRLCISLDGSESATYQRGTNTHTDTHRFAHLRMMDTSDPMQIPRGRAVLRLPTVMMHTMEQDNNRIRWTIRFEGDIRFWPNIADEFAIEVMPVAGRAVESDGGGS